MEELLIFGILSVPIVVFSRRTLWNIQSHGFYRFLSWECIAWLLVSNIPVWFRDPLSITQIISWILLFVATYLVFAGFVLLKKAGQPDKKREEKSLYSFEKTTRLIDFGIYKYIRHPLYASLLYLTWGIFLKNPDFQLFLISIASTFFLFITALFDEKECVKYFGDAYIAYMKRTKRFIPFLL
jgi:protein-S-isoprenylcysteine O-methyltransferase Ste14